MYVLSLVFLLASVASLWLGVLRGGLTLVFVSIGFSMLAALFLAGSVLRRRSEEPPEGEGVPESRVDEWRSAPMTPPRSARADEGNDPAGEGSPLATESLVGIVDRPLAERHGAESEAPPMTWDSSVAGILGPDVVVSDRGTYHLPSCELARGDSSVNMKRAVANRLGHIPCGVCRPG